MISEGFNVENEFLKNIFSEDIYIIKDQGQSEIPAKVESKVKEASPEVIVELAKIAVVSKSKSEIDSNKDLLTKILQAVGINWEEVGIITGDQTSEKLYKNYLVFGSTNHTLINFKAQPSLNQVQTQGAQRFIFTYPLAELESSKEKKKELWTILQKAFLN